MKSEPPMPPPRWMTSRASTLRASGLIREQQPADLLETQTKRPRAEVFHSRANTYAPRPLSLLLAEIQKSSQAQVRTEIQGIEQKLRFKLRLTAKTSARLRRVILKKR
ncbi:hypothetical protein WDW37_00070 [Bdellovibrionota bacterium FG-1]